jgi:hypothetical protein
MTKHPTQPIVEVCGIKRFKSNKIVEILLQNGPFDLNDIARWNVSRDDRVQFAQLIGYSVDGFGELSYVDNEDAVLCSAQRVASENDSGGLDYNKELVARLREMFKLPMAELYGKHPDDFEG